MEIQETGFKEHERAFKRQARTFIFQMALIEIIAVSPPKHAFHYYDCLKALPL